MSIPYLRSPDSYPIDGRTPLTPSQPPIGPLPIIQQYKDFSLPSPATPPESVGEDFYEQDQLFKLCEQLQQQSCTVAVWYPTGGDRILCDRIATQLKERLSGSTSRVEVMEMKRDGQLWVTTATTMGVNYHVFVGLPPLRSRVFQRQNSSAHEEEFFLPWGNNGHRVSEVVFIDSLATTPSQRSYLPKQLKGFLHLDAATDVDEVVKRILGHFGASQPAPYAIDNAYWSKMPKLINVAKDRSSLGITLVTREMCPDSAFPRIALIKALNDDCVADLRRRVGRYTHIQSINGCFLDGYSIKSISTIFQTETRKESVQIMVRFIHSRREKPQPPPLLGELSVLDPTREDLPVPLFILSDSSNMASRLFSYLTTDHGPRSSLYPPSRNPSAVSYGSDVSDPKFEDQNGSLASIVEVNNDIESSLKKGQKPNKLWFQFDSDKSMRRGSICSNYANLDITPTTPISQKPQMMRLSSVRNTASRHYVPQMFNSGFERRFAHIYLRTAGLYLVTGSLKDLADDPLIQFENLSFWLRLIQQGTVGEEKRTIIVGMYDSRDEDDLPQITTYTDILSAALHESDLHKQLFDLNQNKRPASGNHSYVFKFDVARPVDSCYKLYSRLEQCMDLFAEKTFRFYPECFERVFKAFDGLNVALRELAYMEKIVASSEDLKTLCKQKTGYALGTLKAYSPALINPSVPDALLKPHFLIELMTQLGSNLSDDDDAAVYQVYHVTNKYLKPLPVVTTPWPGYVMENIARTVSKFPLNDSEKEVVVRWAESLGLMFKIESDGPKVETYYFVPSLATNMMGEHAKFHWSKEKEAYYRSTEATVLYAYLHFPANHQFFDRLLAVLIKEGFVKRMELFLNQGCMEAILPLFLKDRSPLTVMIIYHPLQNVIEFRTRTHGSKKLPFKDAVLNKLDTAFSSSQFHTLYNFADAITLHVPSKYYPEKLTNSALWKLVEMEDDDDDEDVLDKLLRTEELKAGTWDIHHEQRREIPPELFLRWARILGSNYDHWSLTGSKLKLLTTEDINFMRANTPQGGGGAEVLSRWKESNISVQELVRVLKEVGQVRLGTDVEEHFLPGSDV